MNRDLESWARVDDGWLHNPKVRRAGLMGRALYLAGLLYAHRRDTDGFVSADVLDLLAAEAGLTQDQAQESATKLLEVGLWEREPDGWRIHDYERCQETSSERDERRAKDRERARRAREGRRPTARPADHPDSDRDARVSHADVTRDSHVNSPRSLLPEAEAEADISSSSHENAPAETLPVDNRDDDDDRGSPPSAAAAAVRILAKRRLDRRRADIADPVHRPRAWLIQAGDDLWAEHHDALLDLAARRLEPAAIADELDRQDAAAVHPAASRATVHLAPTVDELAARPLCDCGMPAGHPAGCAEPWQALP